MQPLNKRLNPKRLQIKNFSHMTPAIRLHEVDNPVCCEYVQNTGEGLYFCHL